MAPPVSYRIVSDLTLWYVRRELGLKRFILDESAWASRDGHRFKLGRFFDFTLDELYSSECDL